MIFIKIYVKIEVKRKLLSRGHIVIDLLIDKGLCVFGVILPFARAYGDNERELVAVIAIERCKAQAAGVRDLLHEYGFDASFGKEAEAFPQHGLPSGGHIDLVFHGVSHANRSSSVDVRQYCIS